MKYLEREFKEWDRKIPVYSEHLDRYFFSVEELSDYCYDEEITDEDGTFLRLLLCKPNYLKEIDFNDWFCDLLPENVDNINDIASKELITAMDDLNEVIRHHRPISWSPSVFRTQ